MSQRINREKALKVKCPICGSEPGKQCSTAMQDGRMHHEGPVGKGQHRKPHNERINTALDKEGRKR